MAEAQPFVGTLMRDNSLKCLLSIVGLAVSGEERELPVDLKPLLDRVREVTETFLDGKNRQLSWQRLMLGEQPDLLATQRFILLKPVLDFSALVPSEKALQDVRRRVEKAKQALPGVGIRLTGEVVLEHDELVNVQESTNAATIASMILVCVALLAGFRSWKLMLVTLASMLMAA